MWAATRPCCVDVRQRWVTLLTPSCHPRHFTAAAAPNKRLKQILRQLYLRVHPDLFEAQPRAKQVNSESLVKLNQYISAIEVATQKPQPHSPPQQPQRPFTLTFYLHSRHFDGTSTTSTSTSTDNDSDGEGLHKVSLPFAVTGITSSLLTPVARKQAETNLTRLFKAVGIDFNENQNLIDTVTSTDTHTGADTLNQPSIGLIQFLHSVHEVFAARSRAIDDRVDRSRRTLKLANLRLQGVKTLFQYPHDQPLTPEVEAAILQRFEALISRIPSLNTGITRLDTHNNDSATNDEKLRFERERQEHERRMRINENDEQPQPAVGMSPMSQRASMPFARLMQQIKRSSDPHHINTSTNTVTDTANESDGAPVNPLTQVVTVFDTSAQASHVDNRGRLVLSLAESDRQWHQFLLQPTLFATCQLHGDQYRQCKSLELEVASMIGVHDIFAELSLTGTADYNQFLRNMSANRSMFSEYFGRHPALSALSIRVHSDSRSQSIDTMLGVLLIPIRASIADILALYEHHGHEALRAKQWYERETETFDRLARQVKRRYRLKLLTQDQSVTRRQMNECLARLLAHHSVKLRNGLDSVELIVGDGFDFDEKTGAITIPYNWTEEIRAT